MSINIPRFGGSINASLPGNQSSKPSCHPAQTTEAAILFTISVFGMVANLFLMLLIIIKRPLRRWSQGLLFHQGLVDCTRASLLLPLGINVLFCQRLPKCSYIETAFLIVVTVSTVNLLTSVINDAPTLPEQDDISLEPQWSDNNHIILNNRQCICFGLFIIWFASLTINLGPTFLSGTLWSAQDPDACPMVSGSVRHYVLNVLWVTVNVLCIVLTGIHLRKLHKDLKGSNLDALRVSGLMATMISVHQDREYCDSQPVGGYIERLEQEGIRRVKMFVVILVAYLLFWGPLFIVMLFQPNIDSKSSSYEIALHVAFVHAFVNPTLLLVLHKNLRQAAAELVCCHCWVPSDFGTLPYEIEPNEINRNYMIVGERGFSSALRETDDE
ncbi:uncharacterized protein LOC111620343 [Centruroides sculpturatus]|uniref:uncharacterized protein LOC111620343 n=1 Tax=Centruroides sculpturatus TaxID=218467 RepID=UPI000C6D00B5|nr:uncharacterized protein LOC111620343 [Centruroides sculpturatus]